jgi:murein DD-endopeptidase
MHPSLRRLALALSVIAAAMALPTTTASIAGPRTLASPPDRSEHRLADAPELVTVGERAAILALRMVGTPYRWGGESPASGFDCSGLVRWAYGQVGVELPHNSYALNGAGETVSRTGMRAGDVLVFSGLGHVGLYLGGGRMVHAPYSGERVEVVNLGATNYGRRLVGVRRVVS